MDPDIQVFRNDAITAEEVLKMDPKAIILSPGPGKPSEAGICEEVVKICAGRIPLLGVCLGHQAICEAFGAMIVHARELMHGKQSVARLNRWSILFKGLPDRIRVARYHSLAVRPDTLPRALRVSAVSEDGEIMAVEHERAPIFGLQFHPESIMTPEGKMILKNFLAIADSFPRKPKDRTNLKEVQPFIPPVIKRENAEVVQEEKEEKASGDRKTEETTFDEIKLPDIQAVPGDKKEERKPEDDNVEDGGIIIKDAVSRLINKESLSSGTARSSMDEIMSGKAGRILISSFLTALQTKGATIEEVAAFAGSVREHSLRLKHNFEVMDIAGTGGSGDNTFNISVAVAIILAAAGEKVVKHGNRAKNNSCAAADCLEKLGVNIDPGSDRMLKALEKTNLAFVHDLTYCKPMKYVEPVRDALQVPTVFDMLAPFTNPAYPTKQFMGVYREDMIVPVTHVLESLGIGRAMTVFGQDVFDKISLSAPTSICELRDGQYQTYMIRPEDFGFERCERSELAGGTPDINAEIIRSIFGGEKGPRRNVVLLNAGAALHIAKDISIEEGIKEAAEIVDTGRAWSTLEEFIRITGGKNKE